MRVRRDHLFPLAGRLDRRLHQPEIGMGVVGADVERALMLIDIIFPARLARGDETRGGKGVIGGQQPRLARHMVAGAQDDPLLRRAEADGNAEALVILMKDFAILADRRAQHMHPCIIGAPVFVGEAVEQRLAISGPDQRRQGAGDHVRQQRAGFEIADVHREALAAVGIDAIGEPAAALADRHRAEAEIIMPLRQRRLIEDELVLAAVLGSADRAAIPFAILRPHLERAPVDPVAVLLRHRAVILLDAPLHLREQRVDQWLVRLHRLFEPAILLLQIGENFLVLHIGIAGVAQPGIGVVDRPAMMLDMVLAALRDRGGGEDRGRGLGLGHAASVLGCGGNRRACLCWWGTAMLQG